MQTIFWLAIALDAILLLLCLYETFAVSSNSSLAIPAFVLASLMGSAWWFHASKPKLALGLAGAPAALALLFILFWVVSAMGRKNWQ